MEKPPFFAFYASEWADWLGPRAPCPRASWNNKVMRNVTITLDERTLEDARRYAAVRGISLNAFLRDLISRSVRRPGEQATDELFEAMDRLPKTTVGVAWNRDDLYRG